MIDVRVAHQEDLHVLELEPQLVDVPRDLRAGLGEPAVDEHVPLGRGDEERGHLGGAHRVHVPDHVERLARIRPAARMDRHRGEEQ